MRSVFIDSPLPVAAAPVAALSSLVGMLGLEPQAPISQLLSSSIANPPLVAAAVAAAALAPPARAGRVEPPAPRDPNRCKFFNNGRGKCNFGKNCRLSHEIE